MVVRMYYISALCVVTALTAALFFGSNLISAPSATAHQAGTAPFTPLQGSFENLGPSSTTKSTAPHDYALPSEAIGTTIANGTSTYFGPLMTDVNSDGILDMVLSRPGPGGSNGEIWNQMVALGTGLGYERVYVCKMKNPQSGTYSRTCGCTVYTPLYYGDCAG
jgi:hypothetical protein